MADDVQNVRVFIDRKEVEAAIGRGAQVAWTKFGSYVRQRDRSSIKYKEGKSAPGTAPYGHQSKNFTRRKKNKKTGEVQKQPASPLRELIQYAFDLRERSVVIGPELFRKSKLGGGIAPKVIEEGGQGQFFADGKIKIGNYKPRPHTGPAFRAVVPKAPELIRDKVK